MECFPRILFTEINKLIAFPFVLTDNPGGRVHGSRGPRVAHEALRVRRVRAAAGRAALHHARGAALLPALLRRLLRRVLRRVRRARRRRPGPDVARGPALARHRALLRLPHLPRLPPRPPLPPSQGSHLLLHRLLQGRTSDAFRLLRPRTAAPTRAATSTTALPEITDPTARTLPSNEHRRRFGT